MTACSSSTGACSRCSEPRAPQSIRFHVDNLRIEIGEPFRAGRRRVQLRPRTRGSGGCALEVEESDWATVEPLLTRVDNAGTPPPASGQRALEDRRLGVAPKTSCRAAIISPSEARARAQSSSAGIRFASLAAARSARQRARRRRVALAPWSPARRPACLRSSSRSICSVGISSSSSLTYVVDADDDPLLASRPPAGSGTRRRRSRAGGSSARSPRPCRRARRSARSTRRRRASISSVSVSMK